MKFAIGSFFLVCCICKVTAQAVNDYYDIDRTILAIPASQTHATADIAMYIKAQYTAENKKVRAIYTWVAANIRYNSDSLNPLIFEEDRDQRIASTLRRKKGVCENYAAIFNDICLKSGLRSLVIEGYTRQNGAMDKSPHEWCAVFVDSTWLLYDPTWDENISHNNIPGGSRQYNYYQASPYLFIQSHMPFDPMFQMLNYPVSYQDFYKGNMQLNHNKPYFNYADSLSEYEKLNALNKSIAGALRIQKNGPANAMINNRLQKLKMDIEIIYQDRDTTLYNSAIADYNDALANFNTFINYRNNRFTPSKTESDIEAIFQVVEKRLASANNKIEEVNRSKAGLTLNTFSLQKVLNDLSAHVKEQQDFLKDYFSSAKVK